MDEHGQFWTMIFSPENSRAEDREQLRLAAGCGLSALHGSPGRRKLVARYPGRLVRQGGRAGGGYRQAGEAVRAPPAQRHRREP
jgi:hypothetical protein